MPLKKSKPFMRGKRNGNRTLMAMVAMVATLVGTAALPLAQQLPNFP